MRLSSIVANGQTWKYNYTVIPGIYGQFYQLTEVVRPDNTSWRYEYNPRFGEVGVVGDYSVKRVTYPYGGIINYTYKPEFFNTDPLSYDPATTTIATKTISGPGITNGTWVFNYTPSDSSSWDITTVTTPNSVIKYYHYGYSSAGVGTMWSVGLLRAKEIYDTTGTTLIFQEINDWVPQTISNESYWHGRNTLRIDFETAAPLLEKKTIWRDYNEFVVDYKNYDLYGNVGQTIESTNVGQFDINGALIPDPGRITDYTYDIDGSKWVVNRVKDETITGVGTISRVYDPINGNLLSKDRYGVTTSYTYTVNGDIETITDARSNITRFSNYHRGTAQRVEKPESVVIERLVNDAGTLAWEKDGELNTTSYTYDDLNRLTNIDYPINADVSIVWTANSKTLTRGNYEEVANFDGFGQQIDISRSDIIAGETITTTQQYDALGQKVFQSYPNSVTGTQYSYDALGRVTRMEHPDATFSTTTYGGPTSGAVVIKDERGNITSKLYKSYGNPDEQWLVITLSPENVTTTIDRNMLGQPVVIRQGDENGGWYERAYAYDSKFFLESETNPETGTTLYGRDELGNMTTKQVGSSPVTTYYYDGLNRLNNIDYPNTTPDVSYGYDKNSNVLTVNNINSQRTYTYDANNNLETESIRVGGITSNINYNYNALDVLDTLTYPSNKQVVYKPNALGRSTQVAPYVTNITYHPSGEAKQITYANGEVTNYTLNDRLWMKDIKTSGVSNVVDQSYAYDAAGNVSAISDVLEPSYNRSFEYDGLNRLTVANGVWGAGSITYDKVGNITSKTIGSTSRLFLYSGDNKLALIKSNQANDISIRYDVYGNIKQNYQAHTYDDASNLISSTRSGNVVDYKYDGANNRVVRSSYTGSNTHYVFNKASNLLLEYDPNQNNKKKEYIYFRSQQIAQVVNELPLANAGADQAIYSGSSVTLDGSESSANSSVIASYSWVQTSSGTPVTLTNPSAAITSFTAPLVSTDTELTFDLTITDDTGLSHTDTIKVTVWAVAAPITSPNVKAVQGDGLNTLSWPSNPQATSYNIYWSTSPGVTPQTGTPILGVSTPYVHTGLTNGTDYYYVITAVNAYGESIIQELKVSTGVNGWTAPYNTTDVDMREIEGIIPSALAPSSGRAIAVQRTEIGISVQHYEPGQGWSLVENILPGTYSSISPSINNAGDAVLMVSTGSEIKVARYDTSSKTWSAFDTISTYFYRTRGVDIDDAGNVFALWESASTIENTFAVSRYDAVSKTWGYQSLFGDVIRRNTTYVHKAMQPNGQYIVMWGGQDYSERYFTAGYRFEPGLGWTSTGSASASLAGARMNKLHMAANGDALAVLGNVGSSYYAVWNRVVGGWQTPVSLGDNGNSQGGSDSIDVATDFTGNAVVVWTNKSIPYIPDERPFYGMTVRANRYTPAGGWEGVHTLDTYDSDSGEPLISAKFDSLGNIKVSWYTYNSTEKTRRASDYVWLGSAYPNQNLPPVALISAGASTYVTEATTITLSGSGYDQDGTGVSYLWDQLHGPAVSITGTTSSTATIDLPSFSNYVEMIFRLTVTDSDGAKATDEIKINVNDISPPKILSVTSGIAQNTIAWDKFSASFPDWSSVNLYWSTSPGVTAATGTLISNVVSPYTHSGLQNGTRIYYILTAVDAKGDESVPSQEVFGLPSGVSWSAAEIIGGSSILENRNPKVNMDSSGGANLLFIQTDSSQSNTIIPLMTNRFSKSRGWAVPVRVNTLPAGINESLVNKYEFASDSDGNGFAVWEQYESSGFPTVYSIWASRYDVNTGWGAPFLVENETTYYAANPHVAANENGDFILAWTQKEATGNTSVFAKRYLSSVGWTSNENIDIATGHLSENPYVSINQSGDIAIVWTSYSLVDNSSVIMSAGYDAQIGAWTTPVLTSKPTSVIGEDAVSPVVVLDDYGNAISAWIQRDDTNNINYNVYANRYNKDIGLWGGAVLLENSNVNIASDQGNYNVRRPVEIAADSVGNTIVAWTQAEDNKPGNVYINEYRLGGGWTGAVMMNNPNEVAAAYKPHVVMNRTGDALLTWSHNGLRANYRVAGTNWVGEHVISPSGVGSSAVDSLGNALITWHGRSSNSSGNEYDIFSRYLDRSTILISNALPIANTGPVQYVIGGNLVSLDGRTSSDPDGSITDYSWVQVDGPSVVLTGESTATPTFTAPVVTASTPITLQLTVTDNNGQTNADLVVINVDTVLPANELPVANDDAASTSENTTVSINVLSNDTDTDNDTLIVATITQGTNGLVVISSDKKTISYTPNSGYIGNDTFSYTIDDGKGGTATATVSVSITAVNAVPVAIDDNIITAEDTVASAIAVLSNDSDADGDTLTVSSVTQGTNGSVIINTDNTVSYTANVNFNGNDSFSYTINDSNGGNATGIVSVTVTAVNDLPAAIDDSISTAQDIPVTITVLSNDADSDGDTLTVSAVTQGANGSVVINTDSTISYTPTTGFNGNDSFTYTISDGNGGTASASVTVTVNAAPVNINPVANADTTTTPKDNPITITVLSNDTDADGDTLTVSAVTQGANGSAVINTDNTISYTPVTGFTGNDTFTYTISDGNGGTASATVSVSVVNTVVINYEYSLLNPGLSGGAAQVISLANNNTIQAGSTVLTLNQYEQGLIPASDMQQGATIVGSGPFDIASSISATDMPVPNQFEGTQFVIPHYRNTHYYYLLSTSGNATAQIKIGTTTTPVSLPQGQVITFNAGSSNNLSGIITSDLPIRVAHRGNNGGNIDGNPVPPAALEAWGVRSNTVTVGALNDGTNITVTAHDGSSTSLVLNAGGRKTVSVGVSGGQGKGSGLRISADQPIAALQSGDGDGADQTAFMRTQDLGTRFGIPTDAQYAAIVCPTIGTLVTLYDNQGNSLAQQTCSGTIVGEAYFGATTSGANITAGSYLESDQAIYVMYEDSATNDEHNLLGVVGQN